jgi:hypothetical protein
VTEKRGQIFRIGAVGAALAALWAFKAASNLRVQ